MATSLNTLERACVDAYVASLVQELGDSLEKVWLFGSAARGDMWADFWPMRSDVDLLVVTSEALSPEREEALLNLTYELYLECGRQIAPAFRTRGQLRPQWARLQAEISREGIRIWPREGGG